MVAAHILAWCNFEAQAVVGRIRKLSKVGLSRVHQGRPLRLSVHLIWWQALNMLLAMLPATACYSFCRVITTASVLESVLRLSQFSQTRSHWLTLKNVPGTKSFDNRLGSDLRRESVARGLTPGTVADV